MILTTAKSFLFCFDRSVVAQVSQHLTKYFGTRLEQTGYNPPVNIQADKGTDYHRTRQFTSVVTIVPDSPSLLTFGYLCQPLVFQHDCKGISLSIASQLESWGIQHFQIVGGGGGGGGGSFDGQ